MAGVGKGAEPQMQMFARSVNHQLKVHRERLNLLLDGLNELRGYVGLPGYGKGNKGKGKGTGGADSDLDDAGSSADPWEDSHGDSGKGEGKFSGKGEGKGKFYRDRDDACSGHGPKGRGKFSSKGSKSEDELFRKGKFSSKGSKGEDELSCKGEGKPVTSARAAGVA
jgi:hypothetical protein